MQSDSIRFHGSDCRNCVSTTNPSNSNLHRRSWPRRPCETDGGLIYIYISTMNSSTSISKTACFLSEKFSRKSCCVRKQASDSEVLTQKFWLHSEVLSQKFWLHSRRDPFLYEHTCFFLSGRFFKDFVYSYLLHGNSIWNRKMAFPDE